MQTDLVGKDPLQLGDDRAAHDRSDKQRRAFTCEWSQTGNAERFSEIVDAYELLSSSAKRAQYDLNYERVRESRWRLFNQEAMANDVSMDSRLRLAIMSILYIVRRNNPSEPGVGSMELERLLECPEPVIRFHCWYLKENNWIARLDTGYMAITAHGVDRLFELGGPANTESTPLRRVPFLTPRSQRALTA